MLKLSPYTKKFRSEFLQARTLAFDAAITNAGPDLRARTGVPWAERFIDHLKANLKALLTGGPAQLLKEIVKIESDPDFQQFVAYCALARRPKKHAMSKLYDLVGKLFDYNAMCRDMVSGAYAVVKQQGLRICPYCHLHHLNLHTAPGKKLKLRPPLDHFYPKSTYPYLATALCNLIPSCEQCNSRIKLARDPRDPGLRAPLAHPFDTRKRLSFVSGWNSVLPLDQIVSCKDFQFGFAGVGADAKDFADFFRLPERYRWYEHELLDLVNQYKRFQDADPKWKATVEPIDCILGFSAVEAEKRAVGLILADAAKCIVTTKTTI
jgi:hypothetical protein